MGTLTSASLNWAFGMNACVPPYILTLSESDLQ